jgi:hypothetical protein
MYRYVRMGGIAMMLALAATTLMGSSVAVAASAAEIDRDVDVALKKLYDTVPGSKVLAARARGVSLSSRASSRAGSSLAPNMG